MPAENVMAGPIGVFDSGYGGLTVLREIVKLLPKYDYIYLGDNARAPYGTRSFESVYQYTLECVEALFQKGCHLVILACNTASAKALRTIQQKDLAKYGENYRVLGVIRPTAEIIGQLSKTRKVGILGTTGTINSGSYILEIEKFYPEVSVFQEACPIWVPLVENNEYETEGAGYFIKRNLDNLLSKSPEIDVLLLGCTHYPLLIDQIRKQLPKEILILSQGEIVAKSLENYLERHPEIDQYCSKNGERVFYTTDSTEDFDQKATIFFGEKITSRHLSLD